MPQHTIYLKEGKKEEKGKKEGKREKKGEKERKKGKKKKKGRERIRIPGVNLCLILIK